MSSMLALAACTGQLFQSKSAAPSVYLLSVQAGAAGPGGRDRRCRPILTVQRPRVRTGLDTDLIAVLYPDRRLAYVADARWSGPLDEVVQDLALQAFRAHANLRNVACGCFLLRRQLLAGDRGGGFSGRIPRRSGGLRRDRFRRADGPRASARGAGGSGDRRVLGHFEANERRPAAENRLGAIVEAYDQAVDAALAHLVVETSAALRADLAHQ